MCSRVTLHDARCTLQSRVKSEADGTSIRANVSECVDKCAVQGNVPVRDCHGGSSRRACPSSCEKKHTVKQKVRRVYKTCVRKWGTRNMGEFGASVVLDFRLFTRKLGEQRNKKLQLQLAAQGVCKSACARRTMCTKCN